MLDLMPEIEVISWYIFLSFTRKISTCTESQLSILIICNQLLLVNHLTITILWKTSGQVSFVEWPHWMPVIELIRQCRSQQNLQSQSECLQTQTKRGIAADWRWWAFYYFFASLNINYSGIVFLKAERVLKCHWPSMLVGSFFLS